MDVRTVAGRLGVTESKVLHKALEYQRLLQAKQGGFSTFNTAHSVCCIDLACKLFHHPISSPELLRYSGHARMGTYSQALRSTQTLLSLEPRPTIAQLSIQHAASASHSSLATRLLSAYHQRLPASLPPAQRGQLDVTRASHTLVAFYLAGRKTRDAVEREPLQKDGGVAAKEWKAVESSMLRLCNDVLGLQKRKRKAESGEAETVEETVRGEELDAERVGEVDELVGSATAAYAEWRERVVADEANDRAAVAARVNSDNFDDEAEYGDDEETLEKKRRRGPKQSRLSFAPVRPSPTKRRRGAYTDAVVL